jgi:hypothetical protein
MFGVVPLSGGLLVFATYGIGRRLGSTRAGLIGAWLVATSPTMLFMLVWPMTDVPVAAAWAVAFYFLLGSTRRAIVAAGIAAAVAILIRPNLVPGAAVMGVWYLVRSGSGGWSRRLIDATIFGVAALPGPVAVAVINNYLYGSPTTSGYGGLGGMYEAVNVWPNLTRYVSWFTETQFVLPLAGIAILALPVRRLWPATPDRRVVWIIAAFVAILWTQYFAYIVFDDWWYLRFLLPSWPFIMVGTGMAALAVVRLGRPMLTAAAAMAVVGVGLVSLWFAVDRSVFELWQGERRYVSAGRLVRQVTEPESVIFSMQHSGSLRYYGGRMTLRYDNLDRDWLDRAVAWLESRGVRSYLLVEDWELPDVRRHFRGQARLELLDLPPIFSYEGPANILLFDLTRPRPREAVVQQVVETNRGTHCAPPAPPPTLTFRR